MKRNFKRLVGILLVMTQIFACVAITGVSAATPDDGVEVTEQLFKEEFNYEAGALTNGGSGGVWTNTAGSGDPGNVTIVEEESGNKYAKLVSNGSGWSDGMKHYFKAISSGKVRLSADVKMSAANGGEIQMAAGWNTMRPLMVFKDGAYCVYQESDAIEKPTKKLTSPTLNEWYKFTIVANYDNMTYEAMVSQGGKLLYKETGMPIKDTANSFSYLRFKNNTNDSEFCVDNIVVEKVTTEERENVISGVYDTLDGYESFADGGVPTGNLTSFGWKGGPWSKGIGTSAVENDNGNKYISIPCDGSSIQYKIADTPVTSGLLRFKFAIKTTATTGVFAEVHDSDTSDTGGPVAMHIHGGNLYTKAGYWDNSGTKINMGSIATNEWFDAELTYNLDNNTYSIQLSRDGEVFNCLRDLQINKYNSAEAHTSGIKVIRFRDWGSGDASTHIDNFEFEYLTSEAEQDYIITESKFDNCETISDVTTSPWAVTYKGIGETALVDSKDGKAVSFGVSDGNCGIQYNIPNGFKSGEMAVNFSIKPNNAKGGALITFPSGTGQHTGLVGLHLYNGSFITYTTGYNAGNKNLGKIAANEWYDVSFILDMEQKLYSIQIKHDGEVLGGMTGFDLIEYCAIGDLMEYIGCIRFVDWGKGIGGAGYEMDNFSISYVNPDTKKKFVITESDFDASNSITSMKGWTVDSGVILSGGKLSVPMAATAQKAVPLTDSGKFKVEYTINANGGKAEVDAISPSGSFALASFDGLTEDVTVTNIIDLDNNKVTYYVNGENPTTVDILDKTSGNALYDMNAIRIANTGSTDITVDDLTVSSYIAKPAISDSAVKIADVFENIYVKGEVVNPGVSMIELDFDTSVDVVSVEKALTLTSAGGDTPEFILSTRAGKSVLTFNKALKPGDTYTLAVSADLKNINGESLEQENGYSYSFTTDKADIFAEITAPTVGTKEIYAVSQLKAGDTLKLNANVVNSTEASADVVFVVGYYADNMLVGAQTASTTLASGAISLEGAEITVGSLNVVEEIKILMWNSLMGMMPYCNELVYDSYLTTFTLQGEGRHHTQGIAVDKENGYMYQSIQQDIKKYDIKTGEVVASITGFGDIFGTSETIHIGDISFNADDGLLYCSAFAYNTEKAFVIIVDPEKFTQPNMARDTDGLMKITHLPISSGGYEFAYNYGIDGATFAPLPGAGADSEKYWYISGWSNDYEGGEYSIYFAYDADEIKDSAVAYADDKWDYAENGLMPTEIYFAHTGVKQYGAQTLTYYPDENGIFANFYQDNVPGMPNYAKSLLDLNKAPTEQTLEGSPDASNKILSFGNYGETDPATGIKGTLEAEGAHGMDYLGNGYFYITTTNYNDNMDTPVQLYKFAGGEFVEVN